MGTEADDFLGEFEEHEEEPEDPKRPEAVRGRYQLPHPETGKARSWQRVTNFVDLFADEFMLYEWKFRNVVKGLALMTGGSEKGFQRLADIAAMDVKADKLELNRLVAATFNASGTKAAATAGTQLHKSTEDVDFAHGDLHVAPLAHQVKMALYLQALRENGLTIPEDMIERSIVSLRYDVSGKLDRIFQLPDGTYVIGDLKTNDSLDWSLPKYAAQLECYQEGWNSHGVWDGARYVKPFELRTDIGIIIHLPSDPDRNECHVIEVDLEAGRQINAVNLSVRGARRIKAGSIARTFRPENYRAVVDNDAMWRRELSEAPSREELVAVAQRAKAAGQWNSCLGDLARSYAAAIESMGS